MIGVLISAYRHCCNRRRFDQGATNFIRDADVDGDSLSISTCAETLRLGTRTRRSSMIQGRARSYWLTSIAVCAVAFSACSDDDISDDKGSGGGGAESTGGRVNRSGGAAGRQSGGTTSTSGGASLGGGTAGATITATGGTTGTAGASASGATA